jgi:hypothetical protein
MLNSPGKSAPSVAKAIAPERMNVAKPLPEFNTEIG